MHTPTQHTAFGQRLIKARENAGISQKRLATAVGMSQSTLGSLEVRGQHSSYTALIAQRCNVSIMWLTTGNGDMLTLDNPGYQPEPPVDPLAETRRIYGDEIVEMLGQFTDRRQLNIVYSRIIGDIDRYFAELQQPKEPLDQTHAPSVVPGQPGDAEPTRRPALHR